MITKQETLEGLHKYCRNNKDLISLYPNDNVKCFFCRRIDIQSSSIKRYIRDANNITESSAICPHCGIDSILPGILFEAVDENTTRQIINDMYEYYFNTFDGIIAR